MITVDVGVKDLISGQLKSIQKELKKVPQEGLREFVALTPIKSGNARSRTSLKNDTIVANYAYAQRLDEGYSRQAPSGMTKPWERWLNKRIRSIFGK